MVFEIYHVPKTCAVAALTSRHRTGHHQTRAAALPLCETDQQWAMLKLFGAAATFGVVLR
jgi:hypothetical protein